MRRLTGKRRDGSVRGRRVLTTFLAAIALAFTAIALVARRQPVSTIPRVPVRRVHLRPTGGPRGPGAGRLVAARPAGDLRRVSGVGHCGDPGVCASSAIC